MKFVIVAVILALAIEAQSGLIPLSYTAISGPTFFAATPAVGLSRAVSVPAVLPDQGSYIAQTRGAVHTAPLLGHANSVASINLEPAPGTVDPIVSAPEVLSAPNVLYVSPAVSTVPVLPTEGSYFAQTRGGIHTAPLPGHVNSVAAINLEPAPGTIDPVLSTPEILTTSNVLYVAPAVAPAPALVATEGSYVAQNRGAVHVAPLPGHVNSATSVNLKLAPGTI